MPVPEAPVKATVTVPSAPVTGGSAASGSVTILEFSSNEIHLLQVVCPFSTSVPHNKEDLNPVKSDYGISFNPKMKISDIKSLDDIDDLVIP